MDSPKGTCPQRSYAIKRLSVVFWRHKANLIRTMRLEHRQYGIQDCTRSAQCPELPMHLLDQDVFVCAAGYRDLNQAGLLISSPRHTYRNANIRNHSSAGAADAVYQLGPASAWGGVPNQSMSI